VWLGEEALREERACIGFHHTSRTMLDVDLARITEITVDLFSLSFFTSFHIDRLTMSMHHFQYDYYQHYIYTDIQCVFCMKRLVV
jgi:hypothetical protein